jgi:acyl-CoA dehydrogenase
MEFDFPEDTLMLRDMLRRFLDKEAKPLEMQYFNTGELKIEERSRLRKAIEQLGLWGLTVPEKFGGGGLDLLTTCLIEEELGKTFVPVEIGEVNPLLFSSSEVQINKYLEPALSGDRRAILAAREPIANGIRPDVWTTKADIQDDFIELQGTKLLDSIPEANDFFIVLAKLDGSNSGSYNIGAFIVELDTEGIEIDTSNRPCLKLENCHINRESILGKPGDPLFINQDSSIKMYIRTGARYVGIGERLVEMAAEHARTWVSFEEPLSARPAINRMLAEMRVDVECSRWLVYYAAWLYDEGKQDHARATAAQVRLATGEMLHRLIDRVTMVFAGPGPSREIEPHRFVKGFVSSKAFEMVLEQARAIVAEDVLKQS